MIIKFLRYVRRQPKAVRNQYAMVISATFTAAVALVWVFNGLHMQSGESQTANVVKRDNVPFASLVNQIKDQWRSVTEVVKDNQTDEAQTATVVESSAVKADPRNIKLSEEEVTKISNQQQNTDNKTWDSGSTTSRPVYQEVQIITTSSTKATSTSN